MKHREKEIELQKVGYRLDKDGKPVPDISDDEPESELKLDEYESESEIEDSDGRIKI